MSTPEAKTKERLKKLLKQYAPNIHVFAPVQNGMGSPALDFIICYKGMYCSVETKAGDKLMTPRQEATAIALRTAGAAVFLVNDVQGMAEVKAWLESIK